MSIADEAAELRSAATVSPSGSGVGRCHICGQIEPNLVPFDTHINGGMARQACAQCNPERTAW